MLLSEDHLAVQDAVRQFVQAEIAPHAAAWDKSHQFPAAVEVSMVRARSMAPLAFKAPAPFLSGSYSIPESW